MKGGKKYEETISKIMDWIEYWNEFSLPKSTKHHIIKVFGANKFDLTLEEACLFLRAMVRNYPEHIDIVNIYDIVNMEHWENSPYDQYPGHEEPPLAELLIKTSINELKQAILTEKEKDKLIFKLSGLKSHKPISKTKVPRSNKTKNRVGYYVTKEDDDFYYLGTKLKMSKKTVYYKMFMVVYKLNPDGGKITYKRLIPEIKKVIPKYKNLKNEEIQTKISNNLTSSKNGFGYSVHTKSLEDNGEPLLKNIRGEGIYFNNKKG